jgi:hypothetical protein
MKTEERHYEVSHLAILQPLLRNPLGALAVHWLFQGMLHMDPTERWFKLGSELFLGSILTLSISLIFGIRPVGTLMTAMLIVHTLDAAFNGQVWVVLKHFGLVKHSRTQFEQYLSRLSVRILVEDSIEYAAAYGSVVRGEWALTSDLDLRLVRKPGPINGLNACLFCLGERARAFVAKFPLDVLVLDSSDRLSEMREDEVPLCIK